MLTSFLVAFLWGSGISLGFVVGLVAWSLIRPYFADPNWKSQHEFNEKSLAALEYRNDQTNRLIGAVVSIAEELERGK